MTDNDKQKAIDLAESGEHAIASIPSGTALSLFDPNVMSSIERAADIVSQSALIPNHYRGKPSDCFIALYRATRMGMDPFGFMEGTYVVHNKLAFTGQLYIALINTCGLFRHSIRFDIRGDESDVNNMACTAWTVWKGTDAKASGYCDIKMAKIEKWWDQNPKWRNLPRLMLQYRAAAFLIRLNCPEIAMGYKLDDEIIDTNGEPVIDGVSAGKKMFDRGGESSSQENTETSVTDLGDATTVDDGVTEEQPVIQTQTVATSETVEIGKQGVPNDVKVASLENEYSKFGDTFVKFLESLGMLEKNQAIRDLSQKNIDVIWNNHKRFSSRFNEYNKNSGK